MDEDVTGAIGTLEAVAPFLSKPLVNELCSGRKWADYRERKLELLRARIDRAWARQRQLAKRMQQVETRFVDGVGQHKACIDPELFAFTRSKYRRLAFHDPDNLDYILKQHPELRVPSPKPRYLMVNGFRDRDEGVPAPSDFKDVGAGDGARGDPATAVDEVVRQQTGVASVKSAGSAHETPAPPLFK